MTFRRNKSEFIPNAAVEVKFRIFIGLLIKIAKFSYVPSSCFSGCLYVELGQFFVKFNAVLD